MNKFTEQKLCPQIPSTQGIIIKYANSITLHTYCYYLPQYLKLLETIYERYILNITTINVFRRNVYPT